MFCCRPLVWGKCECCVFVMVYYMFIPLEKKKKIITFFHVFVKFSLIKGFPQIVRQTHSKFRGGKSPFKGAFCSFWRINWNRVSNIYCINEFDNTKHDHLHGWTPLCDFTSKKLMLCYKQTTLWLHDFNITH